MKIKNIIAIFSLTLFGMTFSGCDNFLDINDDPNNPLEVASSQLLTSAQVDISGALGMSSGGLGQISSSFVHHIVQRGSNINDYAPTGRDFGVITPWNVIYSRALKDLNDMMIQAEAAGALHYVAIGQILTAYTLSILVDIYGDVPYSEAFLGSENLNPRYDDDAAVYDAALALLDAGIANTSAATTAVVGGEDLIYGGNMDNWRKLAKSIQLKMYNQMRLVRNVSSEVTALINGNDLISSAAEDFEMTHGTTQAPDDRNPGWVQEISSANPQYYVSPFFFETMFNINTFAHRDYGNDIGPTVVDPRVPYYFFNQLPVGSADSDAENPCSYCPSRSGTGFLSIWQFSFNIDPNEGFDQAVSQTVLGLYPFGGPYDDGMGSGGGLGPTFGTPSAPQRFLTYFGVKFIEAELYLTGVATGDDAAALEEGVRAAFAEVNTAASAASVDAIAQADIDTYVNALMTAYAGADDTGKLEHIMTQKWISAFGSGIDAYTDFRRTGFPILHDGNTDNLAFTVRAREYPQSLPWVTQNLQLNANAPVQKNNLPIAKIFWCP